jgi:Ribbon-helix-helix protein, copG family
MAYGNHMEKTTIYLPDELQGQLRYEAKRQKRPQAELIREAVATYLAAQPKRLPSFVGSFKGPPIADGVDSSNIKQWVRENWIKDLEGRKFNIDRDAHDERDNAR